MWKGPDEDPGGGGPNPDPPSTSNQEFSDLKDQYEQQTVLIAQLKEMLRKEQSKVSQEKVEEYINTLSKHSTKMKNKASVNTVDISASQKINLLRQQLEENKVRFAERGKSQKGIEDMVTQLQAQLGDSQLLIQQTPLNVSLQDNKIDYSQDSSSQELYNILLTKEKRITDLIAKVQSLESNVLDLQENVKEKDSVIDARTKAITLMTENLTKKSKGTLDALDETKEQMRKMQEHFVELESDMKARQMKLLEDLRLKNYEIAELEEANNRLELEKIELGRKLELPAENDSINAQLELLRLENDSWKNELNSFKQKESDLMSEDGEVGKLKKQLEESNKNMIKVKAQHKSKVKELNKKIEGFKKISDVNAEIVKLEAENSRLNRQIAELEEEKGAMQLKMVESTEKIPDVGEFESRLAQQEDLLSEKDKIISLLEAEIVASKNALSEKVTSEMASIQFEEQLESLQDEIARLKSEIDTISEAKKHILEKYDTEKREKQEIQSKLDHYIQENMELVDKLEKLSAEKVSSAESIEIVEGLTQQELEAYQKNLEMVSENLKASEENLPQVDLNDSVQELNEETSELLQKIELFTVERREVMEKMELLKQENSQLTLKIKEVENNRDVLTETYEQLQSEKETLDAKLDALERENNSLKDMQSNQDFTEDIEQYKEELKSLKFQLEERDRYNSELNNRLVDLDKVVAELNEKNADLQAKTIQLNEELETLTNKQWEDQRAIENKDHEIQKLIKERDNTQSVIADLQRLLSEKDESFQKVSTELKERYLHLQQQLNNNAVNLEDIRNPLEAKIEELQTKNKEQLDKMKKIAANLKKKSQAYQELEEKYKNIEEKWESEQQEKHKKDRKVESLLQEMQNLELEVSKVRQVLQEKIEELSEQENRNAELQNTIAELRSKSERVNLQQEFLQTHESLGSIAENTENLLEAKIQELEMIVETQEQEITSYKERVAKLEEGLAFVEERRASTERKASRLGEELEEKSVTCEQITASEDVLEKQLEDLSAHDKELERKLQETLTENQELTQHNQKLGEKVDKLKKKLQQTLTKIKQLESNDAQVEDLETQNETLKKTVTALETELRNLQIQHEQVLIEIKNDLERVNNEWQVQFDQVFKEKTELLIRCEQMEEELKEITEKEFAFNNELLLEYKTKLERSELEIREYEAEVQRLAVQEQELAALKRIVDEKDKIIEELQSQQPQPQDSAKPLASFFDNTPVQDFTIPELPHQQQLENELHAAKEELEVLRRHIIPDTSSVPDNEHLQETVRSLQEQLEIANEELASAVKHASVSSSNLLFNDPSKDNSEVAKKLAETEAERQYLEQELKVANVQLARAEDQIAKLKGSDILKQVVEETVDAVIEEARNKVEVLTNPAQTKETDTFDFVSGPKTENTQAELLNKIKTLEFMLFTVEKAKDDALLQCHELSSELTRLVYERENTASLQSQIIPENQLENTEETRRQLENLEFSETRPAIVSTQPVHEDVIQPKDAYLCYNPEEPLESQIVSPEASAISAQDRAEMHNLEFEPTRPSRPQSRNPVLEDPAQEKEAYLCYDPTSKKDTFGENDDGWGWGPEEARLEAEHVQKNDNKLLEDRVNQLELERAAHLEEIKQLHVKTAKLVKKLKEFKLKNEQLSKKTGDGGDLFNLDDAIQEELKLQIEQVEKKLKETSAELEKERTERGSLLKRVDVLTAAHERMVEMKEKQDVEMLGWQRNCSELSAKLERFEWGGEDGFNITPTKTTQQVDEKDYSKLEELQGQVDSLNETIKELSLDNEELQVLLEEQRTLRLNAEKQKTPDIQPDDFQQILLEKETLNSELQQSLTQRKQLQDQVNELIQKNSELLERFDAIERGREELAAFVAAKDAMNKQLSETVQAIQHEKNKLQEEIAAIENEKLEYIRTVKLQESNMVTELVKEKEAIFTELQEKNAQIDALKETLEAQLHEVKTQLDIQTKTAQSLLEENQQRLADIEEVKTRHSEVVQENELLKQTIGSRETSNESRQTSELLNQLTLENQRLTETLLQKDQEQTAQFEAHLQELQTQLDLQTKTAQSLLEENHQRLAEIQALKATHSEELNQLLQEIAALTRENEVLKQTIASKETSDESRPTSELLNGLTAENQRLQETLAQKQAEYEQRNTEMLGVMEHLSQEWQMRVDQRGSDVAESWKLHLEARESEFTELQAALRKEIHELEEKCNGLVNENNELRKNVDAEIRNEVDRMSALEQQIVERQQYVNELTRTLQSKQSEFDSIQVQLSQFQEQALHFQSILSAIVDEISPDHHIPLDKDSIPNTIRAQKEEKEAEMFKLKQKISQLEQEMEANIENYQLQLEASKHNLDESQLRIDGLTAQLNEIQSLKDYENENSQNLQHTSLEHQHIIADLTARLEQSGSLLVGLKQSLEHGESENLSLKLAVEQKEGELKQKAEELQKYDLLNREIQGYEKALQEKDAEINHHRLMLEEKSTQLKNLALEKNLLSAQIEGLERRLSDTQHHYEEVILNSNSDSQNLVLQLREQSQEIELLKNRLSEAQHRHEELLQQTTSETESFKAQFDAVQHEIDRLTRELSTKQSECTDLQAKIEEQTILLDEENKQLDELRSIIESQVLKIEELKKELFEKSNDYDSLIAEMDISRSNPMQTPVKTSVTTSVKTEEKTDEKNSEEASEEPERYPEDDLTEPVSRAELDLALYMVHQRDMRCEELTVELTQLLEERDTLQLRLSNAIREKEELAREGRKTPVDQAETSSGDGKVVAAAEAAERHDSLTTKLSELRTVGYKRDKTLVDEQALRQLQQLSIMQQHRDAASRLPAEAAARLVDASYTLSRDVQSPSKVLLNWLWGKSTPRVNDV